MPKLHNFLRNFYYTVCVGISQTKQRKTAVLPEFLKEKIRPKTNGLNFLLFEGLAVADYLGVVHQ